MHHIPSDPQGAKPKLTPPSLSDIMRALHSGAWVLPLPTELRDSYAAEQHAERRGPNRIVLLAMTIIFDLFGVVMLKTDPSIALPSLCFRAGMTFLFGVFVILDRRNLLGRAYGPALVTLAVMASVISAVLTDIEPAAGAINNMTNIRAIPLILMATGLIARLTPAEVCCVAGISVGVFIGSVVTAQGIPHGELASLILMDLAIGAGAVFLNLRLETRDRRVFLLQACDRINRAELAARNRGLLLETHTDGLTGVANRRYFDEALLETWQFSQDQSQPIGLIMMDIDHFKMFNDHYGHHGGDECLRAVASTARREARSSDLFARFGGEEFAVILPGAELEAVIAIAERMRLAIEAIALAQPGGAACVTASLGAASMVPGLGDLPIALLKTADARLYAAKRGGRNRVISTDEVVSATR